MRARVVAVLHEKLVIEKVLLGRTSGNFFATSRMLVGMMNTTTFNSSGETQVLFPARHTSAIADNVILDKLLVSTASADEVLFYDSASAVRGRGTRHWSAGAAGLVAFWSVGPVVVVTEVSDGRGSRWN